MSFGDTQLKDLVKELRRTIAREKLFKRPVIEVLNLRVTAQKVPVVKEYQKIARILWFVRFVQQNLNLTEFAAAAALTKGIQINFDSLDLLDEPITTNADFWKYGFDVDPPKDAQGANANNIISARWSFFKYVKGGLDMSDKSKKLIFNVQDDLSARGDEIKAIVQGWSF